MAPVDQVRTHLEEPQVVPVELVVPMDQLHQEYLLEAVEEVAVAAVLLLETMDRLVVEEELETQVTLVLVEVQATPVSQEIQATLEEHQLLEVPQLSVFITLELHHQIHIL